MNVWSFMGYAGQGESREELRRMFGDEAIITPVGKFQLIHLDNPGPAELERRIQEFDPRAIFDDDCPLCRIMLEQGGNVVYDADEDHGGF